MYYVITSSPRGLKLNEKLPDALLLNPCCSFVESKISPFLITIAVEFLSRGILAEERIEGNKGFRLREGALGERGE